MPPYILKKNHCNFQKYRIFEFRPHQWNEPENSNLEFELLEPRNSELPSQKTELQAKIM